MELVGAEFTNNIRIDPSQDQLPGSEPGQPGPDVLGARGTGRGPRALRRREPAPSFPYRISRSTAPSRRIPTSSIRANRTTSRISRSRTSRISTSPMPGSPEGTRSAGGWDGPFVKLSYDGGPLSVLARTAAAQGIALGREIRAWIRIGANQTASPIRVPHQPAHRSLRDRDLELSAGRPAWAAR